MNVATMLGAPGEALRQPQQQWAAAVTAVLREAFGYHFERNAFFRAQCDADGVTPADVSTRADLPKIPMLPVSMFKRPDAHMLLTAPLTDIELEIRSTGTGGVPSVARRDTTTVDRAVVGITSSYRDFFALSKGAGLFLCPSTAEAPEMGMVKVFNMLNGVFDDHVYLVRDYAFDADEALRYLRSREGEMTRHIIGPPFLVNRFLRFLELEDIELKLDPESMVITLGGWKRYTGESISRPEFDAKLQRYLGVGAGRIRDMYGMIESNMLAIECEHHRKHVPPWCYVSIRDVDDPSVELTPGRTGGIAVLDALNTAYPGFLLSDDIGEVDESGCPCGRTGQTVSFRRRRQGAELGCCAVSIEKFLDSQEIVAECAVPAPAGGR
ncbi:LuxE/PaaK family acyltransferase [Mangrovihabitans endophyticus]|uniref:Acyl-protein synthetase n=1 Tax=Mangrovihabitans endophyticus TaxID=1751298 RepID=A0A8J3BX50_9ACTN|nr:acyl-protein synthetase [Mangrovihabitans endophyticus]GGK78273.1 acyl-protein synthetase [Mangrovihabitans endophyticus]